MGIRGLTTFIQSRSHLYMDNYELHDTNIVIDGNAIACQLYRWHCPGVNDCFGGDYDKYAKVVQDFFKLLSECNVIPYVVFDGGYENKKVATVISRMKNKISTAAALDSVSEGSFSVFPLFLRDCFEETLKTLGVKRVRCDFEADAETAYIAQILNCPVLSYDSDFFIFDVLYIPFKTFELKSRLKRLNNKKENYRYIQCQVYRIDKFLNSYGGMNKSNLPVLAVLLGNDYVRRSVFKLFFQNLKIQKGQKNQNEQQKRIKSLIVWLKSETKETAIKKVLDRYKKHKRQRVFEKIQKAMQGYYISNSIYLKYLEIEAKPIDANTGIDFSKMCHQSDADEEENDADKEENDSTDTDEGSEIDIETSSSGGEDTFENYNMKTSSIPNVFNENFRKCIYPPCFMDIISKNRYYCIPQVENVTSKHAHTVSLEIVSTIHKILTNHCFNLTCITRIHNMHVGRAIVPSCNKEVPSFTEIDLLSKKGRGTVFLNILNTKESFDTDVLNYFPKSWHVFICSIKYLVDKSELTWPLVYSLVLCKIVLEIVDNKVGFIRNKKVFDKKFSNKLEANAEKPRCDSEVSDSLDNISYLDSLNALNKLLIYFEMEEKMKTFRKSFDRNLVHSISQFQSCLLHGKYLNCLLNYPFYDFRISQTLNCTFVYNFTVNLKKRTNCDSYLDVLLVNSRTILNAVKSIVSKLKDCCENTSEATVIKKRRKRRKNVETLVQDENIWEEDCDESNLFDPNNKFTLLAL